MCCFIFFVFCSNSSETLLHLLGACIVINSFRSRLLPGVLVSSDVFSVQEFQSFHWNNLFGFEFQLLVMFCWIEWSVCNIYIVQHKRISISSFQINWKSVLSSWGLRPVILDSKEVTDLHLQPIFLEFVLVFNVCSRGDYCIFLGVFVQSYQLMLFSHCVLCWHILGFPTGVDDQLITVCFQLVGSILRSLKLSIIYVVVDQYPTFVRLREVWQKSFGSQPIIAFQLGLDCNLVRCVDFLFDYYMMLVDIL